MNTYTTVVGCIVIILYDGLIHSNHHRMNNSIDNKQHKATIVQKRTP